MWDLLRRRKMGCEALEDELERLGGELRSNIEVRRLLAEISPAGIGHYAVCPECRKATEYFVESRKLFAGLEQTTPMAGPWFATKVLAAIDTQEKVRAGREGVWVAVPQYATRLAWVTAIVLLAGTTWLFEKQMTRQTGGSTNEEFLFGSPTSQPSQDDVLVSMAERNQ
jgi:hypothetical protein